MVELIKMDDKTDFELIKLYLAGNNRAFEHLYGRYRRSLYGFLMQALSSSRGEVDDIFQLVWIRTIDKMPTLRDNGSFYGYLRQTARNLIIDRARKLKRCGIHVTIDDEDSIPIADENTCEPFFEMFDSEDRIMLDNAVNTLAPEQRRVWEMRMQNMAFKDIAEKEKCSLNTVLARMSYAKKNIKTFLETHL